MTVVNIHEAKTHLSKLINATLEGEEVIISKSGQPLVKVVPYQPELESRCPGNWTGQVQMAEDFDELPEEFLKAIYGEV